MIQFGCPCGRSLSVADERRGTEKKCPDCGRLLIVPQDGGGVAQEAGAPPAEAVPAPVTPKAASGTDLPTKACPKCASRIAVSALACRHCGAFLDAISDAVSENAKSLAPDQGLPCERPNVPFWTGMFQTLKRVWLEPRTAFQSLAAEPNFGRAILFAGIFGGFGLAMYSVWGFLLQDALLNALPPQFVASQTPSSLPATVLSAALAPVASVLAALLGGCLYHVGLFITGATRRDLSTSLAVALYITGATYAVCAIPCCGIFLSLWILVLAPMALIHAHGCETWKGIAAVYWPLVLCCIPLGIIFLVFMARSHVGV